MTSDFMASESYFIVDPAKINLKRVIVILPRIRRTIKRRGYLPGE